MSTILFGVRVPTKSEQEQQQSKGIMGLGVTITVDNPNEVKKLEGGFKKLDEYKVSLFKDLVGAIHKYLIRLTPLHTGKLRGGWLAFLDKYQVDYSKQLYDTSLYGAWKKGNKTEAYRSYAPDSAKVEEGKAMSRLEDGLPKETQVYLENTVEYKDAMDFGTSKVQGRHFTDIALYKGEHWFEKYFTQWFDRMSKAGAIVPPPKVEDIPN